MEDSRLLKRLLELKSLSGKKAEEYLGRLIEDVTIEIAREDLATVGYGDSFKTIETWVKRNRKARPDYAYMLKTSKRGKFVVTDGAFAVVTPSDYGLPKCTTRVKTADSLVKLVEETRASNTEVLPAPSRAELMTIIKMYKATPKGERTPHPEYDFGAGKPKVNAELLCELLTLFPGGVVLIDKTKGTNSSLFFKYEKSTGILLPLKK